MIGVERCLAEIRAIREIAEEQAVPYVARSRIGRLVLSTAVLVAEEAGLPPPDLPGPIQLPEDASGQLSDLAARCIRLADISRHITQPSEPLADRWERGWHQLLEEINGLEEQLRGRLTSR
ncbi:MAG: hypothetical protein HY695_28380 [Deltaproteobacteria bacterium]|nr:hypothetical protein [Deltaproteobacteria bacterium]